MKKKLFILALVAILSSNLVAGIFGGGSSSIGKLVTLVTKISDTQVKMQLEQIEQGLRQMEMLQNQATNMLNIDGALAATQLMGLQNSFQSILNIQNQVKSQINDFNNFQNQFKSVYTEFESLKNLSPDQYIAQANKILAQSRNVVEDGLRAVGIANPQQMQNDAQRVQALMSAANTVQGQKAAIQANIQMAGMSYQVLNDLKLLLSQSLATQNTAMMTEIQNSKIAEEKHNTLMKDKINVDNLDAGVIDLLKNGRKSASTWVNVCINTPPFFNYSLTYHSLISQ